MIKYMVFKSRREGYDVRIIKESGKFKEQIINEECKDKIEDLIYADANGKLCCTETIEGAIKLIEYNEK